MNFNSIIVENQFQFNILIEIDFQLFRKTLLTLVLLKLYFSSIFSKRTRAGAAGKRNMRADGIPVNMLNGNADRAMDISIGTPQAAH